MAMPPLKITNVIFVVAILVAALASTLAVRSCAEQAETESELTKTTRALIAEQHDFEAFKEVSAKEAGMLKASNNELVFESQELKGLVDRHLQKVDELSKALKAKTGQGVESVSVVQASGSQTGTVKCPEGQELDVTLDTDAVCVITDVDETTASAIAFFDSRLIDNQTDQIIIQNVGEGKDTKFTKLTNENYKQPDPIFKKLKWAVAGGAELETDRLAYYAQFEKPIWYKVTKNTLFELDLIAGVKHYKDQITDTDSIGVNDGSLYFDETDTAGTLKLQIRFGRVK